MQDQRMPTPGATLELYVLELTWYGTVMTANSPSASAVPHLSFVAYAGDEGTTSGGNAKAARPTRSGCEDPQVSSAED